MKDKNVFEKARMKAVLIPLAGFIAAAALILAVIFAASYFGAFTQLSDKETPAEPGFTEPEKPEFDYGVDTAKEGGSSSVYIHVTNIKNTDGVVGYKIALANERDNDVYVKDVRCMFYSGQNCIKSISISAPFTLDAGKTVFISGDEEIKDADTAVFYASFTDGSKFADGIYKICEIK